MIRRICCLAVLAAPSLLLPSVLSSQAIHSKNETVAAPVSGGSCSDFAAGQEGGGGTAGDSGKGFSLTNLDRSVKPCDDFFKFADGGWIKDNPIPADHSNWATFNKLHDKNEDALRAILDEASKDTSAEPGSNWQKIGDFYASCMNEAQIETAGLKPLDPELQRIADIKDEAGLQAEIARLQREGANAVFDFGSEQDFKDSTQVIAAAEQGGLGLAGPPILSRQGRAFGEAARPVRGACDEHVQADGRRCRTSRAPKRRRC